MKTYIINTSHDIQVDEYQNGIKEDVNFYYLEDKIQAETPRKAIEKYFKEFLYYNFTFDNAYIVHEEYEDENKNTLYYDILVDEENLQATEKDIEEWKKGEKTLYNNSLYLKIYEVTPAVI